MTNYEWAKEYGIQPGDIVLIYQQPLKFFWVYNDKIIDRCLFEDRPAGWSDVDLAIYAFQHHESWWTEEYKFPNVDRIDAIWKNLSDKAYYDPETHTRFVSLFDVASELDKYRGELLNG